MMLLWAWLGCSAFDTLQAPLPDRSPSVVPYVGEGWAVHVPEGARVVATAQELKVDAADGSFWFDARWVDGPTMLPARVPATAWGEERCRPLRWDLPAAPVPDTWTAGGFCTIDGRRYWVVTAVETRGSRRLLLGMIASRTFVAYEDLWVAFARTAMTLQAGDTPLEAPTVVAVRETLRGIDVVQEEGQLPRPGGGVFSAKVSEALAPAWQARRDAQMPARFDGVEGASPSVPNEDAPPSEEDGAGGSAD